MTQKGACAECGGPMRFAPGIGWAHTGTEPPRGAPHRARYRVVLMDELTPCIACGAPVNGLGAGHDDGCPVMVTDTTIAADMARAAIDNRETWDALHAACWCGQSAGHGMSRDVEHVGPRFGQAPRHIAASQTARTGVLVYAPED